jgi:signal transduction histidine kinase
MAKPHIPGGRELQRLLPYLADLELEVDRLRTQAQFLQLEVTDSVARIRRLCAGVPEGEHPALAEVDHAAAHLAEVAADLREAAGYHPAHDQVVAIALTPLVRRVFRRQQRLNHAPDVSLRLELGRDAVDWFPARLHHVLDNLISNALKYRDAAKSEAWVHVALRETPHGYELRVSDNGIGVSTDDAGGVLDLFYRAAPAREAGLGVGLAVVKMLVEQSGGSLRLESEPGLGAAVTAVLPRYDVTDFLT